jgi:hypothetical protein
VTNTSDYRPPPSGELTEAQVRRLLAVHARVRQMLGPRWTELQTRASAIEAKAREGASALSFGELRSMLSEFGGLLRDARRAHVDALNAEGFSNSEYSWVRLRTYEAAGLEVARGVDWSSVEDMIKKGSDQTGVTIPSVTLPEVPEKNRELVKPHVDQLKEWAPLALLGF